MLEDAATGRVLNNGCYLLSALARPLLTASVWSALDCCSTWLKRLKKKHRRLHPAFFWLAWLPHSGWQWGIMAKTPQWLVWTWWMWHGSLNILLLGFNFPFHGKELRAINHMDTSGASQRLGKKSSRLIRSIKYVTVTYWASSFLNE